MAVVSTLSNHFKFQLASGNIDFDADVFKIIKFNLIRIYTVMVLDFKKLDNSLKGSSGSFVFDLAYINIKGRLVKLGLRLARNRL